MEWLANAVQYTLVIQNATSASLSQKPRHINIAPYELFPKRAFIVWFGQRLFLSNLVAKATMVLLCSQFSLLIRK